MEFEQIVKQLEWLDKQQRDNKETLSALSDRLNSLEGSTDAISKQIRAMSKQVTEMAAVSKRTDQYEAMLTKQRGDIVKLIEENDKARTRAEREAMKQIQGEINDTSKTVAQLKVSTAANAQELKKQVKEHKSEVQRMLTNISDFKTQFEEAMVSNDDVIRSLKSMEETRKNDIKHVADVQGELTAVRKRVDETRDKYALAADALRNVENRFTELIASESERKQAQAAFLEQQSIAQIDRDRAWKDWKEKYDIFEKESEDFDKRLQALDEALRGAKKAQDTYLELNTKLERRISEVTEMQRLAEDRLRQEWVNFKVDDQKRWTGYNLSNEESFRDIRKDQQKTEDRITLLNDATHALQDQMHQVTDTTEKELQEIMNVAHEWMTSYQRIMGHGKKTSK